MREKDFEREHAEPKKKTRERRERERETEAKSKNKKERELFFLFQGGSLLSLLSCFFRFFFSRDASLLRSSNIQTRHSFRTTLVFSTSHLSLSESLSIGLSQSLGVVAQKNKF